MGAVECDPPPPCRSACAPCAPLASARVLRPFMLFLTLALRVAILVVLILAGAYDLTFYTYVNLTAVTVLSALGIIGLWVACVQRFYMRFIFPVMVQSTMFVAFAITAIVQLNSSIYMSHAASLGGPVDDGTLHSGDWVVHQFTAILILVDLIVQHHYARTSVRSLWLSSGSAFRAFYTLYMLFAVMIPLGLYALIEDWSTRYPTGVAAWLVWAVAVPLMSAFFGTWYLLFMLSNDDVAHLTPTCDTTPLCKPAQPVCESSHAAHVARRRCAPRGGGTLPPHAWTVLDGGTLGAAMDELGADLVV